jgi:hypothetical protein
MNLTVFLINMNFINLKKTESNIASLLRREITAQRIFNKRSMFGHGVSYGISIPFDPLKFTRNEVLTNITILLISGDIIQGADDSSCIASKHNFASPSTMIL